MSLSISSSTNFVTNAIRVVSAIVPGLSIHSSAPQNVFEDGASKISDSDVILQTLINKLPAKLRVKEGENWVNRKNELENESSQETFLHDLNDFLLKRTFIGGNSLAISDLLVYSAIRTHHVVATLTDNARLKHSNVVRWFDNIQYQDNLSSVFPVVPINRNATKFTAEKRTQQPATQQVKAAPVAAEVKQEQVKKEEPKKEEPKKEQAPKKEEQQKPRQQKEQPAKEKPQPKKQQSKQPPKPQAEEGPDITHLNIRVGKVLNVKRHPDADSLYVEQIDLGEGQPRTIISGLVQHIKEEDFVNRKVLVLANLKPRAMRGIESQGMVLCASSGNKERVELLDPPADAEVGERVTFAGFEGEADDVLNPKKKYFEKVQPEWSTTTDKVAVYKGIPFTTSKGVVTCKTITGGSIS